MENCGLIIEHVMAGLQQKSGGPSYCVPALASALTTHGRHVGLHVLGPAKCEYPHVDLCAYPEWSCARRTWILTPNVQSTETSGKARRHLAQQRTVDASQFVRSVRCQRYIMPTCQFAARHAFSAGSGTFSLEEAIHVALTAGPRF